MWNSKLTIRKTCLPAVDFQVAPTLHCVVFWWSSIEVLNRTLPRHLSVPVLLSRHSLLARHPSCLQRMPCSEVLFPTPLWCVLEMRALILLWWVNICVRSVVQCFNMGQYWYGMLMCCTHLFFFTSGVGCQYWRLASETSCRLTSHGHLPFWDKPGALPSFTNWEND